MPRSEKLSPATDSAQGLADEGFKRVRVRATHHVRSRDGRIVACEMARKRYDESS